MRNQLWQRKPVEHFEIEMKESKLKRVLGKWGLTSLGIGAIIGAGIFVMTGVGAKEYAGPALALSFVVAGIGCTFAALCFAEFASFLPVEGSAYAYSYATMGELFAWIIGWDLILEYGMGASAVAVGWSGYLAKFLHLFDIKFPIWLMNDVFTAKEMIAEATSKGTLTDLANKYSSLDFPSIFGIDLAANVPAFFIIWVLTAILVRGIKHASSTNNLMVAIKVAVVLFIIVLGVQYINPENWDPFIPKRTTFTDSLGGTHGAFGFLGIISGAAYIFFAYIGFDTVSTHAGESKNPQKDVPFGIITSLIVTTVLYILVALVLTGMVNYKDIDVTAPIAAAFGAHGLSFAVFIISLAAIAGLTSVSIVMLLGQSRVFYAISKDGLLPKKTFGEVHPVFRTPWKANILIGVVVSLVSAFTPIEGISKMVNIGTLLAFVMVSAAVWIMRKKEPDRPRPFRAPAIWFVAPMGILFNLGMMLTLEWQNWLRLVVWLLIGFSIYFFYGKKHSVMAQRLKEKNGNVEN
ncbi:amino acid permease [Stygiobacter electus]|uniref:Amino acid permease n=1 Tax=Stygiobacter electus TaxID=3032292 RepID=A0AAE3TFB1_9BACT|nr:amino acid permease [Stygiobacter electus]MDF1613307.1 amino acid permease [Stygiobacter electus]